MKFLRTFVALAVAAVSVSVPATSLAPSDPVLVTAVVDGDTIDVTSVGRVRLLGIDAPELGRGFDTAAPFAREARERLVALVLHRWVRLEQDGSPLDSYNRRLAYVLREDGVFVNAALVEDGLARVTAREPLARLGELKRAENEAQAFRRGMWGDQPSIPSSSYTARSAGRSQAGQARPITHTTRKAPARSSSKPAEKTSKAAKATTTGKAPETRKAKNTKP